MLSTVCVILYYILSKAIIQQKATVGFTFYNLHSITPIFGPNDQLQQQ